MNLRTALALLLIVMGIWLNLLVQDELVERRQSEEAAVNSGTPTSTQPEQAAEDSFIAVALSTD